MRRINIGTAVIVSGAALFAAGFYLAFGLSGVLMVAGALIAVVGMVTQ